MDLALTPDQQAFRDKVNAFASRRVAPNAVGIDESGRFPRDLVREAFALGLAGVTVQREWGGGGYDYVAYALAISSGVM